jgi:hypothetical protein
MPTAKIYGGFLLSLSAKELAALNASTTLKCMLTTSAYTPDQDTHRYKSSVTNEVTGTGYTAGGATLANVVANYTAATNVWKLDADDVSWAGSTITARRAVIYDSQPATDATRPLICYIEFDADTSSTAATFSVQFDAAGIVTVTLA